MLIHRNLILIYALACGSQFLVAVLPSQQDVSVYSLWGELHFFLTKDYEKARQYFEKVACQSQDEEAREKAWFFLGKIYDKGLGVAVDKRRAFNCFEKARCAPEPPIVPAWITYWE